MTEHEKADFLRWLSTLNKDQLAELAQTLTERLEQSDDEIGRIEQRALLECVGAVGRLRFPRTAPPPAYVECWEHKVRKRAEELICQNGEQSPCLIWTGAKNGESYGVVKLNGRATYVHTVAYIAAYKFLPPHLQVNHQCATKLCVNPLHLRAGTGLENMAEITKRMPLVRGKRKGRLTVEDMVDELLAKRGDEQ
jgi:hypothetical protein